MLTVVCSAKGAPGATSTALLLASAWPSPPILIDADVAGGDVAYRLRTATGSVLAETPTVAGLAAAARSAVPDEADVVLAVHGHDFNGHVSVIPGFVSAEQAAGTKDLWPWLAAMLAAASATDVIVDVGRIAGNAPAMTIVDVADAVVVVTRDDDAQVLHLREQTRQLRTSAGFATGTPAQILPLVIAKARHGATAATEVDEILATAGLHVQPAAHLAWDRAGLARLEAGEDPTGRLARAAGLRYARVVVAQLLETHAGEVVAHGR